MKKYLILFSVFAVLLVPVSAGAHERQQFMIGGELYEFVIGSLNEPVSVDDKTGLDLRISEVHGAAASGADHHAAGGAVTGLEETLKVELIAGDIKKVTDISPVYNTPGSYKNSFYPTVATTISYRLFGEINSTPVDLTFTCTPAGHARASEDKTEVKMSDGVTRVLKTGGFGCPVPKEELGFPEKSATAVAVSEGAHTAKNWGMAGAGLGLLSLLVAGYAVSLRRS